MKQATRSRPKSPERRVLPHKRLERARWLLLGSLVHEASLLWPVPSKRPMSLRRGIKIARRTLSATSAVRAACNRRRRTFRTNETRRMTDNCEDGKSNLCNQTISKELRRHFKPRQSSKNSVGE